MMKRVGDAELLWRSRTHAGAFREFYERHALGLRGWLESQVGNREVANDLTAEAFAEALGSLRRFRGRTDAEAAGWLYGIARNLALQYHRDQRVASRARRRLQIPVRDYGEYYEADEQMDAQSAGPSLWEAVDELSANERRALELRVINELSYDEIAQQLDVSVPAARMRVFRAVQFLKARLRGEMYDPSC